MFYQYNIYSIILENEYIQFMIISHLIIELIIL